MGRARVPGPSRWFGLVAVLRLLVTGDVVLRDGVLVAVLGVGVDALRVGESTAVEAVRHGGGSVRSARLIRLAVVRVGCRPRGYRRKGGEGQGGNCYEDESAHTRSFHSG